LIRQIIFNIVFTLTLITNCLAQETKLPNVAGMFYPQDPEELSQMIDKLISKANPQKIDGDIFGIIVPHAGYGFSGQTAAFAYSLIKNKPYKTVIVIGSSHYFGFSGVSVYPQGSLRTPLGDLPIDAEFAKQLLGKDGEVSFAPEAFTKEHSVEVQLPFLQRTLKDFRVVPVVMGNCSFETCMKFASILKEAIGKRKDVLIVVSTDMYHGYNWQEAEGVDRDTLTFLTNMDAEGLYYGLRDEKLQLCGGFGVVSALVLAKELGHNKTVLLDYTNSAQVTGKKTKGIWTVGYSSLVIDAEKGKKDMLNKEQRIKLLTLARKSIETYLATGEKLQVSEIDPVLTKEMGAFVTLNEHGDLRGCIGNMFGTEPLYLTIRDMAIESATQDPRFAPVESAELKDIEIEISVLSPMEKVKDASSIQLGVHGVMVKRGFRSGVFLPQVATETGWSKEEFLSNLCAHKAGLPPDAWKDKSTELFVFSAEVFSEKGLK